MAVEFKESRTKENLMRAFAGESQARNRYTIAARKAKKRGLDTLADIFTYTADQERAHAERFYELLKSMSGETIVIDGGYPVDQQEGLAEMLRAAEHNEREEYEDVYQNFGNVAQEEGFLEAAATFFQIAKIEHVGGNVGEGRVLRERQRAEEMDLHELRLYPRGKTGAVELPGLPLRPGTFPAV